jgi:hypothetical protein
MKPLFSLIVAIVIAAPDVRLAPEQKNVNQKITFRQPDTFGYAGIEKQKKNNFDQFLRSNIDNEANKRNAAVEPAKDMLPCRQDAKGEAMTFTRGTPIEMPLRWNNPHDSDCEVNLWVQGMTKVAPIKRPFNCGGGYKDQRFSFTIPNDFPGCENANDNCVMQIYGHSVEPRTYAMCIDFTLSPGQGKSNATLSAKDVPTTQFQDAIHYQDSFDTSHVDSTHSGYRGQQGEFIRDELKAAIQLQSYVGNGGLVPLGNIDKAKNAKMRDQIQQAIKQAEKAAIQKNKAAQAQLDAEAKKTGQPRKCFEGELYNVVNNPTCARQFTNTYVTNVGYRQIYEAFLPKLQAGKFTSYSPKLKDSFGPAPLDPFGSFKVQGKPSLAPNGKKGEAPQAAFQLSLQESNQLKNLATRYGEISKAAPIPDVTVDTNANPTATPPVACNPDDLEIPVEDKTEGQIYAEKNSPQIETVETKDPEVKPASEVQNPANSAVVTAQSIPTESNTTAIPTPNPNSDYSSSENNSTTPIVSSASNVKSYVSLFFVTLLL